MSADNLKNHCIATEAIMQALAERLKQDREIWGLAGLLHDLDFEYTRDEPAAHGLKTVELLAPYGLSKEVTDAILRHNAEALGLTRQTTMDYALTCAETITGLIVAAALVHPDKKIKSLKQRVLRRL